MPRPVLSLITPTFNRLPYLLETLQCFEKQARPEVELIVVDDGSTDGTYEHLQRDYPDLVLLRTESRRGPSSARNEGLKVARGLYVMPLDSDCFLPAGALDFLVNFLTQSPSRLYLFPCRSWPEGELSSPEVRTVKVSVEDILLRTFNEIIPVLPLDLLRRKNLTYPDFFSGGEPLLLLQLCRQVEACFVGRVVLEYRTDIPMRISSPEYQVHYPHKIAEVLMSTLPFYDDCDTPRAAAHRAWTLEKIGIYFLLAGRRRRAGAFLMQALRAGRRRSVMFLPALALPGGFLRKAYLLARRWTAN